MEELSSNLVFELILFGNENMQEHIQLYPFRAVTVEGKLGNGTRLRYSARAHNGKISLYIG